MTFRSTRHDIGHARSGGRALAILTTAFLCIAGFAPTAAAAPESEPEPGGGGPTSGPRRVVVILIDTLRPDHLGFHGYARETAPFLAGIAARGTVFDRAHSTSSWTAPATSSLFTGLYPNRHGVTIGFFAHRELQRRQANRGEARMPLARLPTSVKIMSERFAAAGYRTFGATTNVNIGTHLGFERGFERFEHERNLPADRLFERIALWKEALADPTRPTFLYLHLNDVHAPYEPREPWLPSSWWTPSAIERYDSEISYLDDQLARLSERLGWGPQTLIVLLSDHGEEFGEHGGDGHGGGLHAELTRVLMVFAGPGIAAQRSARDVSLVDVLPTLHTLAALPVDETHPADGIDLSPLMRIDATAEERSALETRLDARPLLAHRTNSTEPGARQWWAVMRGGWKLLEDEGAYSLFDQRSDPFEQTDRLAERAETARELRAELERYKTGTPTLQREAVEVLLDEELLEALKQLGYVEESDGADATPPAPATRP